MKHSKLHSIAHNYADSLACGLGFVVGIYSTDVFADAASNEDGSVTVDFMRGTVQGNTADDRLLQAMPHYQNAFPEFCEKHGAHHDNFRKFETRYTCRAGKVGYSVTIEDEKGRVSTRLYSGLPGKRVSRP